MTRSTSLQHLKVHVPAASGDIQTARGQAGKTLARPSFAELLRTTVRQPYRRPSGDPERIDAGPASDRPLLETDRITTDVIEESRTGLPLPMTDTTNEREQIQDKHRLNDMRAPIERPWSKPVVADKISAIESDPHGHSIIEYVAATVRNFCNDPDVQANDGWTVRLSLNENILPSTTLHLSLSLHWLLLRFDCGDAQSRQVIAKHRDTLQTTLEETIAPKREVSIDFD
jgi:Type III secretion protein (HpaP)